MKTLAYYDRSLIMAGDSGHVARIKKETGWLFRARALSVKRLTHGYTCFTFVRSPFTRVLSAYLDKIACAKADQYLAVAEAVGKERACDVEFAEFVRFLREGGLFWNAHWAPQVSLIPMEYSDLDFIGRVENLDTDLGRVIAKLGMDVAFDGALSRADRRRNAGDRLSDFYNDKLVEEIVALYADDFSAFSYPRNLGLPSRGNSCVQAVHE